MIQSIGPQPQLATPDNAPVQPAADARAAAGPGLRGLPALLPALPDPFTFSQQMAASVSQEEVDVSNDETTPEALKDGEALREPSVEDWLLNVIGQQAVRVEARDDTPGAMEEGADGDLRRELDMSLSLPMTGAVLGLATERLPRDTSPAQAPAQPAISGLGALAGGDADAAGQAPLSLDDGAAQAGLDALLAVSGGHDEGRAEGIASGNAPAPAAHLERTLKLQAPEARWGEQMLHALRDNVELQLNQRVQSATIRLDPPELGSLEIYLRHESGQLNVQISASQGEVARLLMQTSDRLRQELVGQNFMQVEVQISADTQQGQQGQQQPRHVPLADEPAVIAGNALDRSGQPRTGPTGEDVLVTV